MNSVSAHRHRLKGSDTKEGERGRNKICHVEVQCKREFRMTAESLYVEGGVIGQKMPSHPTKVQPSHSFRFCQTGCNRW